MLEEITKDIQRISTRNLGRDDRYNTIVNIKTSLAIMYQSDALVTITERLDTHIWMNVLLIMQILYQFGSRYDY